jgi:hypothetical protein
VLSGQTSQFQAEQPVTDPGLLAFMEHRIERTSEEFGIDPARFPRPTILLWRPDGPPENRRLPSGPCLIFLKHIDDWHRARFQLAHEVTHGVLSPYVEPVHDWVQEMFTTHIANRAMRELGQHWYADRDESDAWEEAELLSLREIQELDLRPPYPKGLYGRAYVTGLGLIDQIGWERLKLLGVILDEAGRHDIPTWLDALEPREREAVERVLGPH